MAAPIGNLDDFREAVETLEPVPFWAVILYSADNDSNAAVREYVRSRAGDPAPLTGDHCRTFVLETVGSRPIERFAAQDVVSVAEYLGADRASVPGVVFFTEPAMQPEGLSVRLAIVLGNDAGAGNVQTVFGELAASVTAAASAAPDDRLPALRRRLAAAWSPQALGGGLVEGGSVPTALTHLAGQIREIGV